MFENITKPFTDSGISAGLMLIIVAVSAYFFLPVEIVARFSDILIPYAPLWLSILFFFAFKHLWMHYIETRAFMNVENVLLEIKLPEEITQSPLAMETVLNAFFHTGTPTHEWEKYVEGKLREQSSLEIVSMEGELHFYARMPAKIRPVVESQFYSQYPTIELHEAPDYMPRLPYDPKKQELFGVYQVLEKPDPYPIKTYIDWGLDKETDEEFKVDPMAAITEFFGSFGKGEFGLFQIIIRSHQAEKHKPGTWFKKEDWQEEAKREVEEIIGNARGGAEGTMFRMFTESEQKTIEALERNTSKKPFDTGIRMIYMADHEDFDGKKRNGLPTIMRSFQSHSLNNFKPKFPTMFKYPWEDPFGWRVKAAKRELYEGYRWRSYFSPPYEYLNCASLYLIMTINRYFSNFLESITNEKKIIIYILRFFIN